MINERAKFTANTGSGLLSVANSGINGTGTLVDIITGASNGTLLRTITCKGTATTSRGMVRIYVNDGGSTTGLLCEIEVPAVTASSVDHSFAETIDLNITLKSGYKLKASTLNADTIQVIVDALDWTY
jgi:hypothetical protein